MRVFPFVAALAVVLLAACGGGSVEPDHQAEWRDVLRHKKAAVAPDATPEHRQRWADSVRAFVEKHPRHTRAREVWIALQVEFADDLMALGRYQQASRFYRAVLAVDPANEKALRGWDRASASLVITRERLAAVRPGMREREVKGLLGQPMPGWTHEVRRKGTRYEAWYYRTGGGVAAVHFRDGRVIAAEETSSERLGRLGV